MTMTQQVVLFDDSRREHLLPLTFTRPVSLIRVGILTIKEKWERALNQVCFHFTVDYLREKYQTPVKNQPILLINGGVLPNKELVDLITNLSLGEALACNSVIIAAVVDKLPENFESIQSQLLAVAQQIDCSYLSISHPWDIFSLNGAALEADFTLLTQGRVSQPISQTNSVINPERVFIEGGAIVECSVLNAKTGPIYIGANSEVMEGSLIRGPFALCENSTLKLGAKIYGPTTIGPYCKVGGEVNNSVIFGFSNKAHDGFLGNSVVGEWCNLGADTNTSNLKNNYASVRLWSYVKGGFVDTGLQFCGLIMGDHSKCGINTMFNTGTVVGVSANIFGDGFPRNFIPSFSWGGAQGFTTYSIEKALETTQKVFDRRGIELDAVERQLLEKVYELTRSNRHF